MGKEKKIFLTEANELPFLDDKFLRMEKVKPKYFRPARSVHEVQFLHSQRALNIFDISVLKYVGYLRCCTVAHLEIILKNLLPKEHLPNGAAELNRSMLATSLKRLREKDLINIWRLSQLNKDTDEFQVISNFTPVTLGAAGFNYLKYLEPHKTFKRAEQWGIGGVLTLQKTLSLTSIFVWLIEQDVLGKWRWDNIIGCDGNIERPAVVCNVSTTNGNFRFLIERASQYVDFVGFIRNKLKRWNNVWEQYNGNIPTQGFNDNDLPFVILVISTLKAAEHLQNQLVLNKYPFNTLICVEEMQKNGFPNSFYMANKQTGALIPVCFDLQPKI